MFAVVYNYNGQDSCQALFTYVKTCVKSVCEMCKQCVRVQEMRRVNGEIGLLVLLPLSLSLSASYYKHYYWFIMGVSDRIIVYMYTLCIYMYIMCTCTYM